MLHRFNSLKSSEQSVLLTLIIHRQRALARAAGCTSRRLDFLPSSPDEAIAHRQRIARAEASEVISRYLRRRRLKRVVQHGLTFGAELPAAASTRPISKDTMLQRIARAETAERLALASAQRPMAAVTPPSPPPLVAHEAATPTAPMELVE